MPKTVLSIERNADKVYHALLTLGPGWHSRHEIADALGAPRFHANHVAGLELLVTQGKVIAEKHDLPPTSAIERRWEYRLASQEEQKHQQKSAIGQGLD